MKIDFSRHFAAILAVSLCFVLPRLLAEEAKPDEAAEAFERGKQALDENNFDRAIGEFSAAAELRPKDAKYRGMLAVALLEKGDYDQGAAALKAAVKMHPNDIGASYKPTSEKTLSPEAIAHGREQVKKMLSDRPSMADHAEETKFLREWAARKFAGEDLGSLIDWDSDPPINSDAENVAPDENDHGSIQVHPRYTHGPRAGQPREFEDLWAGAIYELHNINNAKRFVELHERAAEGKMTKEEFVGGIVRHEVVAAQQTRAFYLQKFLPLAAKLKLKTEPSLWFAQWWTQPDDALQNFANKSAYPWRPYARQYDWLAVDRFFRLGEYPKAVELLETLCDDSAGYDDHADVHFWLGRCRAKQEKYREAVEEFDAALQLLPDYAEVYHHRAEAHEKLGEKEKADADEKKFKELSKK